MKERGSDDSGTKQVCLDPVKRATYLYSETCIRRTPTVPSLVSVKYRFVLLKILEEMSFSSAEYRVST